MVEGCFAYSCTPMHWMLRLLFVVVVSLPVVAVAAAVPPRFKVDYHVSFVPTAGSADVKIRIEPGQAHVSRLIFTMPESRYTRIKGDGVVEREGDALRWEPPPNGGELSYRYRINKKRRNGGYDAYITPDWTVLRGDGLVPPARVTATRGARSNATLHVTLPADWPAVDTPWLPHKEGSGYAVINHEHVLARPTGWMIAGKLGTRRDVVEGMAIAVAAPRDLSIHRMDLLAMVTATTPLMLDAFGELPEKILVVRAGDPMWRGGLSGPRSLWMHADRPLISENGSSTLMHEVVHVVTRIRGTAGNDWIAEGMAEYYGMEMLRRAGLLSQTRFDKAINWMRRHGSKIKTLHAAHSRGPRTARAVALFADLDTEIRRQTDDRENLDPVARALMRNGQRVSSDDLRSAVQDVLGKPSKVLDTPLLEWPPPGKKKGLARGAHAHAGQQPPPRQL